MANIQPLAQFILSFEGGFVNDPTDRGGATNKGVTIATWKAQGYDKDGDGNIDVADLKLITEQDAIGIMRRNYWNRWRADDIKDQNIANILVDWLWASGKYAITIPQSMLGVKADGIVGPKTINTLNSVNAETLFGLIKQRRLQFINSIILRNPSQRRFEKGWKRRLDAIHYGYMVSNFGKRIKW